MHKLGTPPCQQIKGTMPVRVCMYSMCAFAYVLQFDAMCCDMLQCVAWIAVICSGMHCVAVC